MPFSPDRRTVLRTGLVLSAACAWRSVQGCEVQADFLRVVHPWTRATAADASSAVLCMRLVDITEDDRLVGASSPIATGAEMGGAEAGRAVDVALPRGSAIELHEGGIHLRLTGLRHGLQAGREYPLTLQFERSGTVLARLSVDFTAMRFG